VALVEASKAVVEISAPVSGVVSQVFARVGDTVAIGGALLALSNTEASGRRRAVTQEQPGLPILTRRKGAAGAAAEGLPWEPAGLRPERGTAPQSKPSTARRQSPARRPSRPVGFAALSVVAGSRVVSNGELLAHHPDRSPDDVLKRTGIETRRWAAEGEDTLTLAIRASREVLRRARLSAADLDLIVCSTTSPPAVAPSIACRVLAELAGEQPITVPAYDLSAACSGYLYALGAAYDHLQVNPGGRVLVITADVLSRMLDPQDFDTFFLFADAASATVVLGEDRLEAAGAILSRPALSAKGEDGTILSVPLPSDGPMHMKGPQVFSEAVRAMEGSLARACDEAGIAVGQLGLVIPHQANQRILDAISRRLGVPVYSNIRSYGNTSSTSIPLALDEILPRTEAGTKLGLCAFGAGFTFGAAILETVGAGSYGLPATGR
jgi:2-oxoisovalerate dehydrogenase E1 component